MEAKIIKFKALARGSQSQRKFGNAYKKCVDKEWCDGCQTDWQVDASNAQVAKTPRAHFSAALHACPY